MSDLDDILKKEKKVLQDDIKEINRTLSTLKNQQEEISTEKVKFKTKIQNTLKDMEDEKQAVIKEIQRIHKEIVNNIHRIQDSHLSIFDGFEKRMKADIILYEERRLEYEDTAEKNNLPALRKVTQGRESLPEILGIPQLSDPPIFVPGNLQSVVENLGKLSISSSSMSKPLKQTTPTVVSKFQCQLQGYPSICITKEGDVWLGGHDSRELVMVDFKGQVLKRRKIRNRTNALAVMDCGDVIISPHGDDSRSVSRLLRDGTEQHVYDTSPSNSVGVSVTADQEILICTLDGIVIRSIGGGTNVKEIYKGSGDGSAIHAVEKSDGIIYISDVKNSAVVMISRDGKVLSTFTKTKENQKLRWPVGLVVDKVDNILCADRDTSCVYIIDQDKHMRELVGSSHGIQKPLRLAVDNDNNLWITQYDGTIHVVKYLSR